MRMSSSAFGDGASCPEVAAARHHVLQTLPVRGLRAALWHQDVPLEDGSGEVKFQCAKAASDAYKAARFRWSRWTACGLFAGSLKRGW